MSVTHVLAFVGVVLLAAMTPGPDFAIVVRRSAVRRVVDAVMGTALVGLGIRLAATSRP